MAVVASSSGNRAPPRSRSGRDNNQQVKSASSMTSSSDRDQSSDNRNSNSDDHSNANANSNSNSNSPPTTTAPSFASNSGSALPSRTISQLRVAAIAHVQQQCTLTCYIPPSRVGAVIGRRGATIVHIQREAAKKSWGHGGQVRVSVVSPGNSNSTSSNTGPGAASDGAEDGTATASAMGADPSQQAPAAALWTPVIIRGDPCGAIAAAKLLLPLLSSGPPPVSVGNNGNNNPGGSSDENGTAGGDHGTESASGGPVSTTHDSSDMDDVVMEIPIHRSRHAAIIGKKGLTIAALSADHNVRIMVPHRNQQQHQQQQQPPPQQDANTSVKSPPSNINIVQLEGELENVERCLAKMLMVVCGSLSSSSSNNLTNTNSNPSSATDRGTDSSNHGSTKMQPIESVAAEYETQTSQPTTTTSSGQDKDSVSNNPNIAVSTDTNDNNNGSNSASKRSVITTANTSYNSKKESKFSEQVITVPPQLYHLVPSLGRIRQIGKSTNTNIRRKKLEGTKTVNSANEDTEESGNNNSTPTTQLFVSGKTDFVKNAVSQLERMLTPSLSTGDASSFNNIHPKHKEQQQQEQEDQLQRSGDDSKIVASGTNNSNANESTVVSATNIAASKNAKIRDSSSNNTVDQQGIAQQQPTNEKKGAPSNSKRRNHSGRGGGGGRMGKKRGGRGGRGDGGGVTNSTSNTNPNAKE